MPFTRRQALLSAGAAAAGAALSLATAAAQNAAPAVEATSPAATEPVCLADFEPLAKAKMPVMGWEYINAGAAGELTLQWNQEAYRRIRLKPHVLVDVSRRDTRVTLFGEDHAFPSLLAPTSAQKLIHPEGELATARGASATGTTMVRSCSRGWLWAQMQS